MKVKTRKTLFYVLFPLISVLLVGLAVFMRITGEEDIDNRGRASDKGSDVVVEEEEEPNVEGLPHVVSVPPKSIEVGSSLKYRLKITDSDTNKEDITVKVVRAPSWVQITDDWLLYGSAQLEDSNVQEIVLEISDGEHTVTDQFYLIVNEKNERSKN
jgi:hypothetical protein